LSPEAEAGLKNYLTGPVLDQIIQERSGNIPEVTFVFGHTHKPFQRDMQFGGSYHPWSHVYNSGGWVVDSLTCAPTHGGAVILVDENLDSTSLCMYTEQVIADTYQVEVKASTHPMPRRILFMKRSPAWSNLIRIRGQNFRGSLRRKYQGVIETCKFTSIALDICTT